jgi:hypothetical protein
MGPSSGCAQGLNDHDSRDAILSFEVSREEQNGLEEPFNLRICDLKEENGTRMRPIGSQGHLATTNFAPQGTDSLRST